MRKPITVCLALCTAACASPSQRIATALTNAGLDPARAQCVGRSLERDLSIAQLQQLGNAARAFKASGATPRHMSAADLIAASAQISDPAVPLAVARAAAACS
ncbi:MAG TPA: hypothetical protein VF750_05425 [Sphingomicrobium sp.]